MDGFVSSRKIKSRIKDKAFRHRNSGKLDQQHKEGHRDGDDEIWEETKVGGVGGPSNVS